MGSNHEEAISGAAGRAGAIHDGAATVALDGDEHEPPARRRVHGRRQLPSGRAVLGGLLVAMAMLVSFAVANHHDHGRLQAVVVARHQVRPGTPLTAADLATEHAQLPGSMAARTFASTADLVGQVTLGPLDGGDVIERTQVVRPDVAPDRHELSFPIDRERALDGNLEPGQTVDLLATYGTGDSARTVVVARAVRLIDVSDGSHESLESAGKLVITVALADANQALRAAHATQVAALTLVRSDESTGAGSAAGATSYSLPPPDPGSATR
jgi:Flp pilus assembly protein CpaB